jgi:hypothetical protein
MGSKNFGQIQSGNHRQPWGQKRGPTANLFKLKKWLIYIQNYSLNPLEKVRPSGKL